VGQWYLHPVTSAIRAAIDAENAWTLSQGSSAIVVAVLDTGVRASHPDLAAKLLPGYDFVSDATVANDGGGRDSDPADPGDWVSSAEAAAGTLKGCTVGSSSWHGTRTASLIGAATNNGVGMAGTAPLSPVLPVRVLGKCGGYDSDIIAGLRWAAGLSVTGVPSNPNPARVINLSLGSSGSCSAAYQEAINELIAAKVVVVAAVGNEGLAVGVPANCGGVIAVAGLRHSGSKVGYSNLGPEVAVSAPAGNCVNSSGACLYGLITATDSGSTTPQGAAYNDASNYSVGTSFAAPLVSGTAALMLALNPGLTPGELASLLKRSARAFPSSGADASVSSCRAPSATAQTAECYCTTSTCGAGMLDAAAAVAAAQAALPTAVIRASATRVLVGESLSLDASGSSAPSGRSIASYRWEILSGASAASISGSSTASSLSLLARAEGTVTVRLTLSDSAGTSVSASQSFTVAAGLPTARLSLTSGTAQAGNTLVLDGSASSAQGSAGIVAYLWEITEGTGLASISGSATGASVSVQLTAGGTLGLRLTVTDSLGYSASTSQSFTIAAAPVVASTSTSTSNTTSTSSDSGGGGGAASPWALLGLLLAGGLLGPIHSGRPGARAKR
jgi:serine protease